jgi:hypothetical protein
MTPTEILQELISKKLVPKLEACGFKYSPSQLKFIKSFTDGEILVKQQIQFSLNNRNTAESMSFWTMWGTFLENTEIKEKVQAGSSDWNIPGWYTSDNKKSYGQFDFSDPQNRSKVMEELWQKIEQAGLPYLEKYSKWDETEKKYNEMKELVSKQNKRLS